MPPVQPCQMAVGLFDVLGFRALIAEHEHRLGELHEKIINTLQKAVEDVLPLRHYSGSSELGCSMFSDTLFLWIATTPEDDGAACVERMCVIASRVVSAFMEARMPIRGAIAFGECLAGIESATDSRPLPTTILLGRPVIEAYALEREQEWSGVALCLSASALLRESERWPEERRPFVRYAIPLKQSTKRRGRIATELAIRYWLVPDPERWEEYFPRPGEGPCRESALRKRYETIKFYEYCHGQTKGGR